MGGGSGGFYLGLLVASGLSYGIYETFLERYSVDEEYALISTCVGEGGSYYRKEQCINKLKKCLKDDISYKKCNM